MIYEALQQFGEHSVAHSSVSKLSCFGQMEHLTFLRASRWILLIILLVC